MKTKKRQPTVKARQPNLKERRWAFKHAKEHALEALQDVLTEEHHSFIGDDFKNRDDIHTLVMEHLERFLRTIKRDSFETDEKIRAGYLIWTDRKGRRHL